MNYHHNQGAHYSNMNSAPEYGQFQRNYYSNQIHENGYTQDRSPQPMPIYNEVPQSQSNQQYMPNHSIEQCQPHAYNTMAKSVHSSPVHAISNNMDNFRTSSAFDNATKNTNESDSPVLRSLLSNKSAKRSSPSYNQSPVAKRVCTQASLENGNISPVRTEDSLDYFDEFAFEKQPPPPIVAKYGYEYALAMPVGMTGENLIAASSIPSSTATTPLTNPIGSSPITNYVESISTPPQSPIEHVNQMSNAGDTSSGAENAAWNQNGSDCK